MHVESITWNDLYTLLGTHRNKPHPKPRSESPPASHGPALDGPSLVGQSVNSSKSQRRFWIFGVPRTVRPLGSDSVDPISYVSERAVLQRSCFGTLLLQCSCHANGCRAHGERRRALCLLSCSSSLSVAALVVLLDRLLPNKSTSTRETWANRECKRVRTMWHYLIRVQELGDGCKKNKGDGVPQFDERIRTWTKYQPINLI